MTAQCEDIDRQLHKHHPALRRATLVVIFSQPQELEVNLSSVRPGWPISPERTRSDHQVRFFLLCLSDP
jgi:hypothetical protein